jgi:hypothetical protein
MSLTLWLLADTADSTGIGDWASVVSAGIAAIAALFSFVSVRQARRERIEDRRPQLLVQPLLETSTATMSYSIANAGRGLARQTRYLFTCDDMHVTGSLDTGVIRPDEEVVVTTSMTATKDSKTQGVVLCVGPGGESFVWNAEGRRKRLRHGLRRRPDYVSPVEALRAYERGASIGTPNTAKLSWRRGGPE